MNKKSVGRFLCLGMAVLISAASFPALAKTSVSAEKSSDVVADAYVNDTSLTSYKDYIADKTDFKSAEGSISLTASQAVLNGNDISFKTQVNGKDALVWGKGNSSATWKFSVPENAFYNIRLIYSSVDTGVDYTFSLKLDGKTPFAEAETLTFLRVWENVQAEFKTDKAGNQLSPEQKEIDGYCDALSRSRTGETVEPYSFYLTAGEHSVTLENPKQSVAVAELIFEAPEKIPDYSELSAEYDSDKKTNAETIVIEGESAVLKSSSSLIAKSDNSNAGMTPKDPMLTRLNYIGGTSWQDAGQFLVWEFEVEESGYYSLGFRYRQSDVINAESWRWLKIDGKTPFEEAKGIRFPYSAKWEFMEYGGEDAYYFWLEKGKHTLSLEVTLGAMSEYFYRLYGIVEKLGDKYIDIVKITGATPNVNLDYELFTQIPDLKDTFTYCDKELLALVNDLESFTGKRSSQYISAIKNMSRVLNNMLKRPYTAHQYVTDYYTNYTSLSSWLYDMKKMPLCIDTIQFAPFEKEFVNTDAGIFEKMAYSVKKLVVSFFDDYLIESKKGENDNKSLKLWVNWGRDQATSLDTLIRDSFTTETGIPVSVQITNASLVNGILSGNFPDMALHMARTEPVNLGIRGALTDLSQFEDSDEVLNRFQPDAQIPYTYNNKLYALPDTQNFYMLFYRTDILENLGLSVPETWDEFLYTAAIIQRNNMDIYVPYTMITSSVTINTGIGSLNLFATLMGQKGLSLYNKELNATSLTGIDEISVFDFWTELYTDYGYQKEADFYNRFRAGTMPIGIAPYTTYLTLYSAAPEIKGRWSVACVPGTTGGNNSVAGGGTGCAIIKKSQNQEEAWEFLKWWTSAETQTRYSNNVESLIGMLGRQATSTVDGLKNLAWDSGDLDVILNQWSRVKEVPEVPGSYYLGRALDQAYWSVLNDGVNAKDAIVKWSKTADSEIKRKIQEYS